MTFNEPNKIDVLVVMGATMGLLLIFGQYCILMPILHF